MQTECFRVLPGQDLAETIEDIVISITFRPRPLLPVLDV